MLLLGHIGITAFISSLIYLPVLGGIVGSLLPDIIDKGLFLLGYAPCSRFIAHSIFFFPVAGLVTYLVTRNKKLAIAVALGAFLHLLQDMHNNVPFLYPLKYYAFFDNCKFRVLITPYIVTTEIIGGLLLIFMTLFNSKFLYLRNILWDQLEKFRIVKPHEKNFNRDIRKQKR